MTSVYRVNKYGRVNRGQLTIHTLLRSTEASVWTPVSYHSEGQRHKRSCTMYRWFEDYAEAREYSGQLLDGQEALALAIKEFTQAQREAYDNDQ